MYFATFHSEDPLSDLPRALDELRRAEFQLCGVEVTAGAFVDISSDPNPVFVRIEFRPSGRISADTWFARIARMPGVISLNGGPLPSRAAA